MRRGGRECQRSEDNGRSVRVVLLPLVSKINLVFLLVLIASAFLLPLTDKESLTVILVAGLLFGINLALIQRFRGAAHTEDSSRDRNPQKPRASGLAAEDDDS